MDNFNSPSGELSNQEQLPPQEAVVTYPPKFQKKDDPVNMWVKSFLSLALYLVLGYYIFHSWKMLLLITAIVMIHELGHFFAMKYFRYNELGIFFIPLLGAYVSGSKREVSQKESAIILLAGPLPGILLGCVCYILWQRDILTEIAGIDTDRIAISFIFLNLINLIPIYPLDGGQLLNRVFLDEESWISKLFVFLSAAFLLWVAWKLEFWILVIFPIMLLFRFQTDKKYALVEKRIDEENINADVSYKDLSDEDYWKIRNILIEEHPSYAEFNHTPPYAYHAKEEKMMTAVQGLLHRHLIQDLSIFGKIFIILLCLAAFASPWLLDMNMSFLENLGFRLVG
jgi:stage IV sporulation protein FB